MSCHQRRIGMHVATQAHARQLRDGRFAWRSTPDMAREHGQSGWLAKAARSR